LNVNAWDLLKKQVRQIRFPSTATEPSITRYNIKAFDALGRQQITTYRTVRFLPSTINYLQIMPGNNIPLDFKTLPKYAAQYDDKIIKGLGWNLVNGTLRVGDGVQYKENVDTKISFFANTKATTVNIQVKATYESEENFDYLQIGFTKNSNTTHFLRSTNSETGTPVDGVSGKGVIDQVFTAQVSGEFEIFARFISDGGVISVGATIESITVSA
jgi:hypothetical protein